MFQAKDKSMDSSNLRSKPVRLILIVIVLLFFPVLGFMLAKALSLAYSEGTFVKWHSLGKPPWSVVNIIGGNPWTVWLEGDNGQIYQRDLQECRNSNTECWKRGEAVDTYFYSKKGSECESSFKNMKSPPLSVMNCLSVVDLGGEWYGETHYALLKDGSIWYWEHSVSGLGPYGLIGMDGVILCGGIFTGLFVSLSLFLYWQARRKVLKA